MNDRQKRIGVWLIGAKGGLGTTVIAGAALCRRDPHLQTGLLTETDLVSGLDLLPLESLVFGGHDIRSGTLYDSLVAIDRDNGTFPHERRELIRDELRAVDDNLRSGSTYGSGKAIEGLATGRKPRLPKFALEWVERFQNDINEFRVRHQLDDVVVVNVASTEPPLVPDPSLRSERALKALLKEPLKSTKGRLRSSILYGYAAADLGLPMINFTPNQGFLVRGIRMLASRRGAPYMGNDGKTGETLVKSALAPMFRYRNLKVLSWMGYNLLGDQDGQVLSNPANRETKLKTKDGLLQHILGYQPHTKVSIDYVPSLKDLKTAWDFIHFEGFLNFRMTLQFTWAGCDAILAAPLILDMIRFAEHAKRHGEAGLMTYLSCFFKAPVGVDEHDLHFQFHHLLDYVEARRTGSPWPEGGVAEECP